MSLDWSTLAFQTVNVTVLIWLLSRLFWRPLAQVIAARRAETDRIVKEAEAARDAAETLRAELNAERDRIATDRQDALKAARAAAEAERGRLLESARDEARQIRAAATARIEADRAAAQAEFSGHAADLALDMAARLGRDLDGPALRAACLDELAARIGALSDSDRSALATTDGLVVATATAVPEAEQDRIRDRLFTALGAAPVLAFRTDPPLVAGLELTGAHMSLSFSWRDVLARMREGIVHDD